MFARTSTWNGSGEILARWGEHVTGHVRPAVAKLAGNVGAVFLIDRSGGRALTLTLWESEQAARASDEFAEQSRAKTVAATGIDLIERGSYEVVALALRLDVGLEGSDTRSHPSLKENKALVRRFYEQIDEGNASAMDELVAEDYVDHSPPPFPDLGTGREAVKRFLELSWKATPGHHLIEDQIAEGDRVVTRLTAYGRHEADLPGIPCTGADLRMTATVIHRIADGRLAEKWSDKDTLGLLQQLGVVPRPADHPA